MKIVFGWRRLTPPAFIGGAELTEASLAAMCLAGGHEVEFVGSFENPRDLRESSRTWLEHLLREAGTPWEHFEGGLRYRYRGLQCTAVEQTAVEPTLRSALRDADVLFTSQEGCAELARLGRHLKVFSYVHSVSETGLASASITDATLLAPSVFVQRLLWRAYGRPAVLLRTPLSIADRRDESTSTDEVLLVNPVREKGVAHAVELAVLLPETPFLFVEGWRSCDEVDLPPNVRLVARMPDLNPLYRRASVLLVPSMVEDASPRVIAEASAYGVPAMGAPVGGIPELIPNESLLITTDRVDQWVDGLKLILGSGAIRRKLGEEQLTHAMRLYGEAPAQSLVRLGL